MPLQTVEPRIRGFICTNAHPDGCRENLRSQVRVTASLGAAGDGLNVLVVGASTGYGLAARIAAAFGFGAKTVGVFFERPSGDGRTASAGYYNSVAFHEAASQNGLYASSLNGDAFSDDLKRQTLGIVKRDLGPVDLLIYSLASPRRTHPTTGVVHTSVLKPVGASERIKSLDLNSGEVTFVEMPPATQSEIDDTVAVMGGEDFGLWTRALLDEGLLAQGARAVAFSYTGPELTQGIYRRGTIGRAKEHLEATTRDLNDQLRRSVGGQALVSVNKAVVTQASAAIPAVPLYLSMLYPVMRDRAAHEDPIEQMNRLLRDHVGPGRDATLDDDGRIRLDDREMRVDIQEEIARRWVEVTNENLGRLADVDGYRSEFRRLFGFEVDGVDYGAATEVDRYLP